MNHALWSTWLGLGLALGVGVGLGLVLGLGLGLELGLRCALEHLLEAGPLGDLRLEHRLQQRKGLGLGFTV